MVCPVKVLVWDDRTNAWEVEELKHLR
jgi:hypothetical protein